MGTLLRLAVAAATVPLALSSPTTGRPAPGRPGSDAIYRSSVEKALERARDELERSLELYVDHSSWEDPWIVERAPFRVRSTSNWRFTDDTARNLGTMVEHFEALLERPFPRDEIRDVFIFPDIGTYNDFGSPYAHHTSILGAFYADQHPERPIAACDTGNWVWNGRNLTHGALHMYLARVAPRALPVWFEEGLASYFAYYYWENKQGVEEWERMLVDGRVIPLERLLSADLSQYTNRPDDWFVELAMFFTYMIHYCPETATSLDDVREGSFVDYLRKAVRGERLTRHPVHRILTNDLEFLEPVFLEFQFPKHE